MRTGFRRSRQDGSERENGVGLRDHRQVDLTAWPEGARLIVRRERPHPGAQLSFTDHDGYRFQAILTDQPDTDIANIECTPPPARHVEDRIRDDKDTGLAKFPFKDVRAQRGVARDRAARARSDRLDPGAAARRRARQAEPKRLRYRLFIKPEGSPAPHAKPSYGSSRPGPGHKRSSMPSRASGRYRAPPRPELRHLATDKRTPRARPGNPGRQPRPRPSQDTPRAQGRNANPGHHPPHRPLRPSPTPPPARKPHAERLKLTRGDVATLERFPAPVPGGGRPRGVQVEQVHEELVGQQAGVEVKTPSSDPS